MAKVTYEEEEANNARQHRISRRRGEKRLHEYLSDDSSDTSGNRSIPLSAIKGIKKQARYEPVIPMSKTELTKWRKEARRVRNRESAAASRRKTRDRIEELEGQVESLEHKYGAALKRIAELEDSKKSTPSAVSPPLSPKPQQQVMPSWSLDQQDAASALAKSADYETILTTSTIVQQPSLQQHHHQQQQPNLMISRPTAVSAKISDVDDDDDVPRKEEDDDISINMDIFASTDSARAAAAAILSSEDEDDMALLQDNSGGGDDEDLNDFLMDTFPTMDAIHQL